MNGRLVEGGDGYMLSNLNDLNVQRTIRLNVEKMTYLSYATFLSKNKYFAGDDLGKIEYLRHYKNGLY